ncbi:variant erythrocyte surface antigen-1 family protein [Babesia caballi]|uniref:Variant erythrocyte surface antigen-1 family protein n=1 Tax=Babesia caballi TaxID=5871 RepID=A0AAV4LRV7_BABCB|nr:variant erythrocyte surface antigen-1 family protein [Babesia caballi]
MRRKYSPLSALVNLSFECPSNLKGAIDWILRVTGKDGQRGGQSGTAGLAGAVNNLISTAGVAQVKPEITIERNLIDNLAAGLARFIGYGDNGEQGKIKGTGIAAVPKGKKTKNSGAETPWTQAELKQERPGNAKGYVYSYEPKEATWSKINNVVCVKIFPGCIPLCYYALTYLYWRFEQPANQGGWINMQFTSQHGPLGSFMLYNGFTSKQLSGDIAKTVLSTAFGKFQDFEKGMKTAKSTAEQRAQKEDAAKITLKIGKSLRPPARAGQRGEEVSPSDKPTYPEFLQALKTKWSVDASSFTPSDTNSISILYFISYLYFTAK